MKDKSQTPIGRLDRNISAIHKLRVKSDEDRRFDQKFVDGVAAFMGSTISIYAHLGIYGACYFIPSINDSKLSLFASLEAIFLAIFVLINQRRMSTITRTHGDLHLQMTMLTEHELTKLAKTTEAIAKKVGVTLNGTTSLKEVKEDIHPNDILQRISKQEAEVPTALTKDKPHDSNI